MATNLKNNAYKLGRYYVFCSLYAQEFHTIMFQVFTKMPKTYSYT